MRDIEQIKERATGLAKLHNESADEGDVDDMVRRLQRLSELLWVLDETLTPENVGMQAMMVCQRIRNGGTL